MAQGEYEAQRTKSRSGICLSQDELDELDNMISPALRKGHSIGMIYMEYGDEIPVSKKTSYNYLDQGLLGARNIDCRRRVGYRIRKVKKRDKKRESEMKKGHEYECFLKHKEEYPEKIVWEMDMMEGVKGGKLFMTLMMRETSYMFMFLIENKEQTNTVQVMDEIERILGHERFKEIFQVILTDNGTEFSNPEMFEMGLEGKKRTQMYYCESGRSDQKGVLERNHEFLRYIVPKGTSIDELDEEATLKIMNNINSVRREKLKGTKPIEQMKLLFGNMEMQELGIVEMSQDDVLLRPSLVRG